MSRLPFDLGLRPESDPAAPRPVAASTFRWATVVNINPLSIRLDGEAVPLDATPSTLAGGVTPGDRVWTQLHGRQVIILGAGAPVQSRQLFGFAEGVTTDASGDVVIEHGQGWVPRGVFLTSSGPNDLLTAATSLMTESTFTVHATSLTGAAHANKTIYFQWLMVEG